MREVEEHIEEDLEHAKQYKQESQESLDEEPKPKESDEKKENRKLGIIVASLILLFAVFIGTFLFFKSQGPVLPTYTYNGFAFEKYLGLWTTQWQRGDVVYDIHLRFGPKEAKDVPLDLDKEFVITNTTYITFEPEGEDLAYIALASTEITLSLSNVFGITATAACRRNVTVGCERRPIITCNNTNETVIFIKEDAKPRVSSEGNCLIIQGRKEEIVRAADKVIWKWYGIIK